MIRILVVDDEPSILEVVKFAFEREGWKVETTQLPEQALKWVEDQEFDILLTDLSMPKMNGVELLQKAKSLSPKTNVLIMTAYGSMKVAIDAMKEGAQDFIAKPFEIKHLVSSIKNILEKAKLRQENQILKKIITKGSKKQIIGNSKAIKDLMGKIEKVAPTESSILVVGETGTGKELVARKIHASSKRKDFAFISVNCSAIPENLLESELFGYRKGAFTGADTHKMGLFEACDGGTIFLDEIGEMPMALQAKLLRVLAEKTFIPLGGVEEKIVNVRVLAATHQDLQKLIKVNKFREDLFYRINIVELVVPSLRDRKEDIPVLADFFLQNIVKEYSKKITGFTSSAMEKLQTYNFPGNIRELEHLVEQAVIFEETDEIQESSILTNQATAKQANTSLDLEVELEKIERSVIEQALQKAKGNKTKAAKLLGITFRSLRYRLQKLGYTIEEET